MIKITHFSVFITYFGEKCHKKTKMVSMAPISFSISTDEFLGAVRTMMAGSGLAEILEAVLGVGKLLNGYKF